ncbi:hypothetical protein L218DRAFT_969526 [Marasmius fiardii PR-910]|nr:hypothetical protein L218DRAFT_969526 [Marasmius fiardii PR-910]
MVQYYDEIPTFLIDWIKKQFVFWVATAPLSPDGHVNVSGKGIKGTFHIVNNSEVWYEDLTGSCETMSHLRENGRITIYFNAFEGPPRIARLFGKGRVFEFGTPEYNALLPPEKRSVGSRSVVVVDVHKVATSCGYAIPFYDFKAERPKYNDVASKIEGKDWASPTDIASGGLKEYWKKMNHTSIDGLPAMELLPVTLETQFVPKDKVGKSKTTSKILKIPVDDRLILGFVLGVLTVVVAGQLKSLRDVRQLF